MIASSVTGSMSKMRSSIAEPIVNFVNRVRGGISSAWTYAKNTPMSEVPGFKQMNEVLNTPINLNINMPGMARISGAWASMKDGFYSGMEYMQKDCYNANIQSNSILLFILFCRRFCKRCRCICFVVISRAKRVNIKTAWQTRAISKEESIA